MYEHVRTVVWGLILSLTFTIATGIVAVVDPFNNGVPWANWLAMSVVTILAVVTSTITAASVKSEGRFWFVTGTTVIAWMFIAGISGLIFTTAPNGSLESRYHSLAWTVYAIPLAALPLSALVQYLVGAAQQQGSRSANIRRIA